MMVRVSSFSDGLGLTVEIGLGCGDFKAVTSDSGLYSLGQVL
jgi:hypothetical protein